MQRKRNRFHAKLISILKTCGKCVNRFAIVSPVRIMFVIRDTVSDPCRFQTVRVEFSTETLFNTSRSCAEHNIVAGTYLI